MCGEQFGGRFGSWWGVRVIPACAGNRVWLVRSLGQWTGHPCVCGEQAGDDPRQVLVSGSSLRVRGTEEDAFAAEISTRVIPACAGNSFTPERVVVPISGHPCVCGEQQWRRETSGAVSGSSLRVRGTGRARRRVCAPFRVIPACAGHRPRRRRWPSPPPGHPCVCGEQHLVLQRRHVDDGSSLRVRGTGVSSGSWWSPHRVIPACAGNSAARSTLATTRTGHPCVCGEQFGVIDGVAEEVGSSLRVRGTDCVSWRLIEFSCQIRPP